MWCHAALCAIASAGALKIPDMKIVMCKILVWRTRSSCIVHTMAKEESLIVNSIIPCDCHPYNLYCVGGNVKPCSINQSTVERQSSN